MNEQQFAAAHATKLGFGLPAQIAIVQMTAAIELMIKTGAFTREQFREEVEKQFLVLSNVIEQQPVRSPITIVKK